jgi:4-amino-4-deoxy-L-arabinose transferase-like glycosyltransferase
MKPTADRSEDRSILWLLLGLAALKLLLHLGVNLWGGYGIFRDELYYLACADHLAWGYVDQPPLSIFLLAGIRAVLGDSLFALRFVPALAGAALVFVTGLLAREMGGGRFAVILAATASLTAGAVLAVSSVYSMNIFDLLLVALTMLLLARLVNTDEPRWWIAIGLLLGLGLLNKVGVLWIGLGLAAGLVLTRERRWLATRWPWLGGAIALALFLPYLLWNAANDWAHLAFIDSAVSGKYSGLDAWSFLSGLVLEQNPFNLLLWLSGLAWLLFSRAGARYRILGIVWLAACLVLLANGHSKSFYLASAFAMLFAAGGVAWEQLIPRRASLRALAVLVVALGAVLAPFATPVLPVETYIRYSRALGIAPGTDEGHELAELPQFYADMFGWESKAAAVAAVFHALPQAEREAAAIFAENYGRAGAIDYWADEYDLPGAVGSHNNYWLWGPGDATGEVVIVLGGNIEDLERRFDSVELAGVASCDHCIPYEGDVPIHVGRGLRLPMAELWPLIGHYD